SMSASLVTKTRTSFTFASDVTSTSSRSTSLGFASTRSFVPALRFSFFARLIARSLGVDAATPWRDSSRVRLTPGCMSPNDAGSAGSGGARDRCRPSTTGEERGRAPARDAPPSAGRATDARPGRTSGRARGSRVRCHEPALAARAPRPLRRGVERLRADDLHLDLEAALPRPVHEPERQPELAASDARAQLHLERHALSRGEALARRRGVLRPRGHRRAATVEPPRPRRSDPELRAPEGRLGDAADLP